MRYKGTVILAPLVAVRTISFCDVHTGTGAAFSIHGVPILQEGYTLRGKPAEALEISGAVCRAQVEAMQEWQDLRVQESGQSLQTGSWASTEGSRGDF